MSFLYPNFLFASILIVIPIALHLFNLRRYKKVYFSNVQMLEDIQITTKKSSQLKHLLVLLTRIFFILALGSAILACGSGSDADATAQAISEVFSKTATAAVCS